MEKFNGIKNETGVDPEINQSLLGNITLDFEEELSVDGNIDDDLLVFAPPSSTPDEQTYWKVMIVDDEPSVHKVTEFALRYFTFEKRSLQFISVYSAAEALEVLPLHSDIAFILLDVVMETPDAGLRVAQYIREIQGNRTVRIVLRTGQPGPVPEESVVLNYDINDYKTKVELTQSKLFNTVVTALRAYRDLIELEEHRQALAQANAKLLTFNQELEVLVKQRTKELSQEIKVRQAAEQALRIYVNALTHDLRNPVIGLLQILRSLTHLTPLDNVDPPAAQITFSLLQQMVIGCDRLLKMIEQLLNAEEYSNQGVILHNQTFQLSDLIASLLNEWQSKLDEKRIILDCDLPNDLPNISGDYLQVWRVFDNLFSNAVKYNQLDLRIEIKAVLLTTTPPMVRIMFRDDGVGISPVQCESIFDLYQRGTHPGQSIRGLGIGLFICRQIIEAHGGEIGVVSQIQEGAQFWLTLPIQKGISTN